jgi:hypothetical protein
LPQGKGRTLLLAAPGWAGASGLTAVIRGKESTLLFIPWMKVY